MADNSTAAADTLKSAEDLTHTGITGLNQDSDQRHINDNSRFRTQDIYQLIGVFVAETRKALPCDGIEYREDTSGLYFADGNMGEHRYDYTIRLGERLLGKISFSRETAFQDDELILIDNLTAGLVLPLRNALRYHKAVRFALRDELTGLRNGSAYYDNVTEEIERARRYKVPFSMLLINLDNFSDLNQRYGHEAGDAVLVEVAARLERDARRSDIIFRKGGDEFLVFLPHAVKSAAQKAAERIKQSMSAPCLIEDFNIRFTTSIGVVTVLPDDSAFTITSRADRALYHAKIHGKDRIQAEPGLETMLQE